MSTYATVEIDLVLQTCWCGMPHAVPRGLSEKQKSDKQDGRQQKPIYCPLGHGYMLKGEGKAAILEKQLQQERQRHDQTRADRDAKERQVRAAKGQVTKIKNRVKNGVCPCCKRTFQNLHRHMQNQHPEFSGAEQ